MKIGIVAMSGIYPVGIGGPEKYVYHLTKELENLDIKISLFTRIKNKDDKNKLDTLKKVFSTTQIFPFLMNYNKSQFLNIPSLFSRVLLTTVNFQKELKELSLIHFNAPPVDLAAFFPILSLKSSKIQTYFLHHGLFAEMEDILQNYGLPPQSQVLFQNYFKFLVKINAFKGVIVPSNYAHRIATHFGVPESRIFRIPVGVDASNFSEADPFDLDGDPKILFVGRIAKIKGIDLLLRAFHQLLPEFPNAKLYLVGKGPDRPRLERLKKSLNLNKNVIFLGFVPEEDLSSYYKSCDIYVLPSFRENQPITLLEAMASKCAIVATNIEGVNEIIMDGINGLLTPVNNVTGLSKTLSKLLSDIKTRKKMGENGFKIVLEKYNYSIIAQKFKDLFERLLHYS